MTTKTNHHQDEVTRDLEEFLATGIQQLTLSSGGLADDDVAAPGRVNSFTSSRSSTNSNVGGRSNFLQNPSPAAHQQNGGRSAEKWFPSLLRRGGGGGGGVGGSILDRHQSTEERAEGIASSLLARKMYQLSPADRESTLHDVHGISEDFEETEELIQQAISKTLEELNKMIRENHSRDGAEDTATYIDVKSAAVTSAAPTSAYNASSESESYIDSESDNNSSTASLERALQQNSGYVTDRVFLLKYLRTDRFDYVKAAKRLTKYFEEKEYWFGRHLLTQKIMLRHLDERALRILNIGQFQILRGRDQSGRAISISLGALSEHRTDPLDIRALIQAFWKLSEVLMEDEMTQKKGVVFINYTTGAILNVSGAETMACLRLHYALPGRVVSMHACVNDAPAKAFFLLSTMLLGDHMSTRYRCHLGSHMEVQYDLNTFGIPQRLLPISTTGDIDVKEHQHFFRRLGIQEDSSPDPFNFPPIGLPSLSDSIVDGRSCISGEKTSPSIGTPVDTIKTMLSGGSKSQPQQKDTGAGLVVVPGEHDVLLGRGKFVLEHIGNVKYRHMLGTYKERYEMGTKSVKSDIIDEIVEEICKNGGTFLEQDQEGGCWAPASNDTARQKVSHYFRNQKRIDMKRAEKAGAATSACGKKISRKSTSASKDCMRERLRDDVNYNTLSRDQQLCNIFPECFSAPNPVLFNTIDDSHHHHSIKRRRSNTKVEGFASTFDGSLFHDIDDHLDQQPSPSSNPSQGI
mmetsp:Transcript_47104/g.114982  ORF Transcript_47104/g.114982 Transcript_47104/m.114982 type:complete len:746 (-) Transcript_47104:416-2653(-)|eukprot:CAMPEP_0113454766 /NCGR_PEP_ID=MMETSP0014_2-20120614/8033_1 /TAXON_ID=2857 /ORGANISM="Nitzschia sp." /LENGTH=745 /DNA_ID=CAMNT_0000346183 /DNA_START=159 /DNA_END=2396 /DNA_ORIENTATION=+ /assembly_acc=CAM_ASM_000159